MEDAQHNFNAIEDSIQIFRLYQHVHIRLVCCLAGFAERIVTKELVATNGTFETLTTNKLCVCVTEAQSRQSSAQAPPAQRLVTDSFLPRRRPRPHQMQTTLTPPRLPRRQKRLQSQPAHRHRNPQTTMSLSARPHKALNYNLPIEEFPATGTE